MAHEAPGRGGCQQRLLGPLFLTSGAPGPVSGFPEIRASSGLDRLRQEGHEVWGGAEGAGPCFSSREGHVLLQGMFIPIQGLRATRGYGRYLRSRLSGQSSSPVGRSPHFRSPCLHTPGLTEGCLAASLSHEVQPAPGHCLFSRDRAGPSILWQMGWI